MSREVLGSALEDVAPPSQDAPPAPGAGAVLLDDKAATRRRAPGAGSGSGAGDVAEPVAPTEEPPTDRRAAVRAGRTWATSRLDALRGSRGRTAAALAVVAVVAALLAVGVTEQVRQARLDAATGVVAWLDYSDSGTGDAGRATLKLNVVNTGTDPVTVTAADLDGGLEDGRPSGVVLDLLDELTVAPAGYASGTVAARVLDCGNAPVARGGSRDGDLRVTVAGTDLRDEQVPGTRIGSFPISSSTIVELTCGGQFIPTVVVTSTQVRADGRLYVSLRGFDQDLQVGLTAPDGVRLVTDPESPVPVPGGDDAPLTTISVALEVVTCTVAAQQLDAGNQVMLDIGDQRFDQLDHTTVNAWVVREVARACD